MFSFEQVDSDHQYERIGGTSTGGGTFWGLGSLLTDAKVESSFDWPCLHHVALIVMDRKM